MRTAFLERINPLAKAVSVLLCCFVLMISHSWTLNLATLLVCVFALTMLSRCSWRAMAAVLLPSLLLAVALASTGLFFGSHAGTPGASELNSMASAIQLATRVLALVALGTLFALSTNGEQLVTSLMMQAHLKPKFAYGVLAAYHLLPTISREWEQARLAYQVRGYRVHLFSFAPLFNALVNCVRWSETVAMAMESKGFDGDAARTFIQPIDIQKRDILFCTITLAAMLAGAACTFIF